MKTINKKMIKVNKRLQSSQALSKLGMSGFLLCFFSERKFIDIGLKI